MNNEIGSEFCQRAEVIQHSCVPFSNDRDSIRFFLAGRSALDYIIRDIRAERSFSKVYMPSYCCESMLMPFINNGIQISFYEVRDDTDGFHLNFDCYNDCDAVLLLDYFGYENPSLAGIAENQKNVGKTVIYDAAHKLNRNLGVEPFADYVFCSYRKWFFANAASAWKCGNFRVPAPTIRNYEYEKIKRDAASRKRAYLDRENGSKDAFLTLFSDAEYMLDHDYTCCAGEPESIGNICNFDIEAIKNKRCVNAKRLIDGINALQFEWLTLPITRVEENDCPLCVPVLIAPAFRNAVRQKLISEKIYCPVHWPVTASHTLDESWKALYYSELSLVCDQRYCERDMDRILESLENCINAI